MKQRMFIFVVLWCIIADAVADNGVYTTTWENINGKTVEASLLGIDSGTVELCKLSNQDRQKIPIDSLSKLDQSLLINLIKNTSIYFEYNYLRIRNKYWLSPHGPVPLDSVQKIRILGKVIEKIHNDLVILECWRQPPGFGLQHLEFYTIAVEMKASAYIMGEYVDKWGLDDGFFEYTTMLGVQNRVNKYMEIAPFTEDDYREFLTEYYFLDDLKL